MLFFILPNTIILKQFSGDFSKKFNSNSKMIAFENENEK